MLVTSLCQDWIDSAYGDYWVIAAVLTDKESRTCGLYYQIMYYSQQMAEKMLKAYLLNRDMRYYEPYIRYHEHDLDFLRLECLKFDKAFSSSRIEKHCAFLTDFFLACYPDSNIIASSKKASRALNSAKRIYNFVLERLGKDSIFFKTKIDNNLRRNTMLDLSKIENVELLNSDVVNDIYGYYFNLDGEKTFLPLKDSLICVKTAKNTNAVVVKDRYLNLRRGKLEHMREGVKM